MVVDLQIEHEGVRYGPAVEEGITWQTERYGSAGCLEFTAIDDGVLRYGNGDHVVLTVDGVDIFYGFVFEHSHSKDHLIQFKAYDQLRYFKNKDTYVYEGKTAGELLQMICRDFNLQTGVIEDTGYRIPSRIEDGQTLFDIIQNAIDQTLTNAGELLVLYDDFGKLALRNVNSMVYGLLIDSETAEDYKYVSSIDSGTCNQVKLVYDNEDTGKRDVYMAKHQENINRWGVLQYYDTIQKGENGPAKAEALLSLYNRETKTLSIDKAFGDLKVRAGSLIGVVLDLGDTQIQHNMLVEKCKHTFGENEHFMDLTLRGGGFIV